MNVFILCTGRCGSTTLIKACKHISNYSSAHESRTGLLGSERLNYPANHIEADNRLSWLLGRLDEAYGDDAFYVHLKRELNATAASFVKRYDHGIMRAYRRGGIMMNLPPRADPMSVALDYCETVNRNIETFLRNKSRKMEFRLEHARQDYPLFCQAIGAEVSMDAALLELERRYNASRARRKLDYRKTLRSMMESLSPRRI